MAVSEIQAQFVKVPNGSLAIDAYLALPQSDEPKPAVLVIQEIFGVNDHIRDVTRRVAAQGYVAIAPAIYQRQAPGFEVGYDEAGLTQGRIHKNQTKADELLSDLDAAIDYLQELPQVKPGPVGCMGFCFGGHVAYLAGTLSRVNAIASFYGAGIATFMPGGGEPTLSRTAEIVGKLFAFFGLTDPLIPLAQIDQVEATLKAQINNHQVFRYPEVDHGFFCDQRASYNAAAAADAWEKTLSLFAEQLG
ncbi:MAG: dienelactone hydrolase family protein [Cyanobacteria bacterium P01_H01_bin.15]